MRATPCWRRPPERRTTLAFDWFLNWFDRMNVWIEWMASYIFKCFLYIYMYLVYCVYFKYLIKLIDFIYIIYFVYCIYCILYIYIYCIYATFRYATFRKALRKTLRYASTSTRLLPGTSTRGFTEGRCTPWSNEDTLPQSRASRYQVKVSCRRKQYAKPSVKTFSKSPLESSIYLYGGAPIV